MVRIKKIKRAGKNEMSSSKIKNGLSKNVKNAVFKDIKKHKHNNDSVSFEGISQALADNNTPPSPVSDIPSSDSLLELLNSSDSSIRSNEHDNDEHITGTNKELLTNERNRNKPTLELCLPSCLYNRTENGINMLKCCQCMIWVHPKCCGESDNKVEDGIFNCSECRTISKRLSSLEMQMEVMHTLNKDLMLHLEKSQSECSQLRELLQTLMKEKYLNTEEKKTESPATRSNRPSRPKPVPAPRTSRTRKPMVTVIGDSMIRNTGPILAEKLRYEDTCVLSKSGENLESVLNCIPDILSDTKVQDSIVVHLGANDLNNISEFENFDKYDNLLKTIRNYALDNHILVTAVAKKLENIGCHSEHNQKVDNLNYHLRYITRHDPKTHYVNCCPPTDKAYCKGDKIHFSGKGTYYFANHLVQFIKQELNFQKMNQNMNQ